MSDNVVLKMTGINKYFPGVQALKDVELELEKGEVHALVGENGAGKSTLMKVLTGVLTADSGSINYNGTEYSGFGIHESKELGIGMIYQELNLVPKLSVSENIYIGNEPKKGFFIDRRKMRIGASELLDRLGLEINPDSLIEDLTVAYQQVVEIAKSISENLRILIMDEPTAPLTNEEVDLLFRLVRTLKEQGVSIIYISHRIEEIFEICDRVTIMRDGQYVKTVKTSKTNKDDLIKSMVGRELKNLCPHVDIPAGETVLKVSNIITNKLKGVSLNIRKGEILGLGGLVGAGRTEIVRAIFGADSFESGEIMDSEGTPLIIKSPRDAIKKGIVLIPEDRKLQGLLLHMSVKDNISLPNMDLFSKKLFIDNQSVNKSVNEYIDRLSIKTPHANQIIKNLSGGNQQKAVMSKWLLRDADIIIFDEPTRGVDVGAKYEIYMLLNELKKMGKAIVMVSSEMEELVGMSDRIVVMCEGRITGELSREELDQEKILWLASQTEDEPSTKETVAV